MSAMAEQARSKAKAKAESMARGDPKAKVDASSWTPSEPMHADSQTGMRVLSRRAFKSGGKVHGSAAKMHAGRKPRKSGGSALTADSLINRNVKEANEERDGIKHIGGMKKGGKVHADEAEDKKLMHKMGCGCGKCSGGRVGRKSGGRAKKGMNVNIIITQPKDKVPMMPPGMPPPGPGGPVGLHQGAPPPQMPPAGAAPPMGPPMQRKSGGRAYPIDSGAGGGLGRLEKAKAYG